MRYLLKSFSYLFHPLFMPLAGVIFYFYKSLRYFNNQFIYSKLFATGIMTVIIPILCFYMLKNLRQVETIHLRDVRERPWPLVLQIFFTFLLLHIVFDGYEIPELYFFFVGILGASIGALVLALLKFKVSLHMIGVSGLVVFVIGLSLHFQVNLLLWIALSILASGAVATSRLEVKAHTYPELIIGFIIGGFSQFLMFAYWI